MTLSNFDLLEFLFFFCFFITTGAILYSLKGFNGVLWGYIAVLITGILFLIVEPILKEDKK